MKLRGQTILVLILSSAFFTLACPKRETISRITGDPDRYQDKEVAIAGRVTNSYGALGTGVYEIDDGTGKLWVVAQRGGVPSRGAQVGTRGRLFTGFTLAGRNFGTVLEETDRRIK